MNEFEGSATEDDLTQSYFVIQVYPGLRRITRLQLHSALFIAQPNPDEFVIHLARTHSGQSDSHWLLKQHKLEIKQTKLISDYSFQETVDRYLFD